MKKTSRRVRETVKDIDPDHDTIRDEYDFSGAMRGATAARYAEGTNVVVLDPDVSALFPTSLAVNEAWSGRVLGVQPRIRLTRSFDQRYPG